MSIIQRVGSFNLILQTKRIFICFKGLQVSIDFNLLHFWSVALKMLPSFIVILISKPLCHNHANKDVWYTKMIENWRCDFAHCFLSGSCMFCAMFAACMVKVKIICRERGLCKRTKCCFGVHAMPMLECVKSWFF